MNSYLSLIPISAKVHRRQNRMTVLCIVFAVFLVTAVFSMAELGMRAQQERLIEKHGSAEAARLGSTAMGRDIYLAAAVLSVLVLLAGILMIAGSMNRTAAQRTKFFGMMRCIGMSRRQIICFVRLEALNWCKTAVPAGILLGVAAAWGICAVLRLAVGGAGGEFENLPLFGISRMGIAYGAASGILAVVLASGAPAKRAAASAPVTAVSGNAGYAKHARGGVNARAFKIETALGIHHAVSAKKNLVLVTGSFALSIILYLCFLVLIDFAGYLLPQDAGRADIVISSADGSNSVDSALAGEISGMDGVKRVFGRRSSLGIPVQINGKKTGTGTADVVSYDDFDLDCLVKNKVLKKGSDISRVYGDSRYVLAAWDKNSSLRIGDTIQAGEEQLEIAGLLKYDPFSEDGLTHGGVTLIVSGRAFQRLTGESGYSLVLVQTEADASDADAQAIRQAAAGYEFRDERDMDTSGTYRAFVVCVYGFLAVIVLVTVLNIVNSMSMSVAASIRQYGFMRASGMDGRQITKMIAAEAFTHALSGCIVGCAAGLPAHWLLYNILIAGHFAYAAWSFPVKPLFVILLSVLLAAAAAVCVPARRIGKASVIEIISEQ